MTEWLGDPVQERGRYGEPSILWRAHESCPLSLDRGEIAFGDAADGVAERMSGSGRGYEAQELDLDAPGRLDVARSCRLLSAQGKDTRIPPSWSRSTRHGRRPSVDRAGSVVYPKTAFLVRSTMALSFSSSSSCIQVYRNTFQPSSWRSAAISRSRCQFLVASPGEWYAAPSQ